MTMPEMPVLAWSAVITVLACGCSSSPDHCEIDPFVVVTDGTTGVPLCQATLLATTESEIDASQSFGDTPIDASTGCVYYLKVNTLLPYTITVSAPGYRSASVSRISAAWTSCSQRPAPQKIALALQPD